MYDVVSGWEFVLANARLHRLADPEARRPAGDRDRAHDRRAGPRHLDVLQGHEAAHQDGDGAGARPAGPAARRAVQRHGPAAATAADGPAAADWATPGRTVLFSSHILEEVEQIAGNIQVMVAGRHAASGDFREIRRLMTERPHQYTIRSERRPGARRGDHRRRQRVLGRARRPRGCSCDVQATDFASFVRGAAAARPAADIRLYEVSPPTSRWRASSPTWWRDERDRRPAHRSQPARPAPGATCSSPCPLILLVLAALVRGARRRRTPTSPSASSAASRSPRSCRCSG